MSGEHNEQMSKFDLDAHIGQVGIFEAGEYRGKYVLVEHDHTKAGWHIWILEKWPGTLPNDGWDIWADDEEQLADWFEQPDFRVRWLGRRPADTAPDGHPQDGG